MFSAPKSALIAIALTVSTLTLAGYRKAQNAAQAAPRGIWKVC